MMIHVGTIPIETERLLLRRFTIEDVDAAFRNWMGNPEVTRFLRWPTHQNAAVTNWVLRDWISHYDDPAFYQWAIELKILGEPIGSISVVEQDERTGRIQVGYCIGQSWWHQGYTSEALAALIPFFFEKVQARRIEAIHDPNNPHSGGVMKKCGLHYEGTLRQVDWNNQGIVDACVYGLLADEYFSGKK